MKRTIQFIALLLVVLALPVLSTANQVNITKITGNGIAKTQDRQVSSFHAIKVSGGIDVELSQGNELRLQVLADENLLALIHTKVNNGVLNIYHDENIQNSKIMKVHLTFKQLDAITANGGCEIESKQKLNFGKLKMELSGGCDVKLDCKADIIVCGQSGGCDAELHGEAEKGTFNVSGGCDVKASEFHLKECNIDASGGSDISVNVTGELTVKVTGASNVTYYGKPSKVIKSAHGASDIIGK